MIKDTIETTLSAVGKLPEWLRSARSGGSLIEYTRVTRAEPITMVDSTIAHISAVPPILQAACAIFAGYYLSAVSLSVNVGKIDVVRLLEKVNPSRSPSENIGMMAGDMLTEESYRYGLPSLIYSKEDGTMTVDGPVNTTTLDRDVGQTVYGASNLATGMFINVHIESDGQKATIPVQIRLNTNIMQPQIMSNIMTHAHKNRTTKERYHAWRSGELEFLKDIILCSDIIDEHRYTLMKDKSGVYQGISDRASKNKLSALLSGNPSVATASNILVMSNLTQQKIEADLHSRLNSNNVREVIFKNTYIMLMFIVSVEDEMVTIYHRGISTPSRMSFKDIELINNKKGSDVGEILKAYRLGSAPTF